MIGAWDHSHGEGGEPPSPRWQAIFEVVGDALCVTDADYVVREANPALAALLGRTLTTLVGRRCWEVLHGTGGPPAYCPATRARQSRRRESVECEINHRRCQVTAYPWFDATGHFQGVVHWITDISEPHRLKAEREQLIGQLREALARARTLSGLLPICCRCKCIRDDDGDWRKVEQFIEAHSGATFTHSICPHCAQELYPDFFKPAEAPPAASLTDK